MENVKLDFARKKNGFIEIYDWKTGKEGDGEEASLQIGAYAIYAMGKWGVALKDIKAFLFHVSSPEAVPQAQKINEALIEKLVPVRERGYSREYTVPAPGLKHRGARRIVSGRGGELYYSDDHYQSFRRIRE